MTVVRKTIRMSEKLNERMEAVIEQEGYRTQNEFIQDAIRHFLKQFDSPEQSAP